MQIAAEVDQKLSKKGVLDPKDTAKILTSYEGFFSRKNAQNVLTYYLFDENMDNGNPLHRSALEFDAYVFADTFTPLYFK